MRKDQWQGLKEFDALKSIRGEEGISNVNDIEFRGVLR